MCCPRPARRGSSRLAAAGTSGRARRLLLGVRRQEVVRPSRRDPSGGSPRPARAGACARTRSRGAGSGRRGRAPRTRTARGARTRANGHGPGPLAPRAVPRGAPAAHAESLDRGHRPSRRVASGSLGPPTTVATRASRARGRRAPLAAVAPLPATTVLAARRRPPTAPGRPAAALVEHRVRPGSSRSRAGRVRYHAWTAELLVTTTSARRPRSTGRRSASRSRSCGPGGCVTQLRGTVRTATPVRHSQRTRRAPGRAPAPPAVQRAIAWARRLTSEPRFSRSASIGRPGRSASVNSQARHSRSSYLPSCSRSAGRERP